MSIPLIIDIVGVLGFFLALVVFITDRMDKRPRLAISVERDQIVVRYTHDIDDRSYEAGDIYDVSFLDISNPSDRRIKIKSVYFEVAKRLGPFAGQKQSEYFNELTKDNDKPLWLSPGDNLTSSLETPDFREVIGVRRPANRWLRFRVVVHTGARKTFFSRWYSVKDLLKD